jgi:uncharacterized protein with GYD domain
MHKDLNPEYVILFRGITEAIHELEDAMERLKELQQAAEKAFIEREDTLCETERGSGWRTSLSS